MISETMVEVRSTQSADDLSTQAMKQLQSLAVALNWLKQLFLSTSYYVLRTNQNSGAQI